MVIDVDNQINPTCIIVCKVLLNNLSNWKTYSDFNIDFYSN